MCTSVLFFPEEYPDGYTCELELRPELVFQVIFIGILNVLRMVGEESKGRHMCSQLGNVLDLYRIPSYHRWVIGFNGFQHHFVQL